MRLALLSVVLLLSSFHGFAAGDQAEKEGPRIVCFADVETGPDLAIIIPKGENITFYRFSHLTEKGFSNQSSRMSLSRKEYDQAIENWLIEEGEPDFSKKDPCAR